MKNDFFKGIVQWEMPYKKIPGVVPIFYFDNTSMTAVFTASTKKVMKYLPHLDMRPVEVFPGRCAIGFTAFEYRKSDIKPYNEFAISVLITFGKRSIPGVTLMSWQLKRTFTAYIWHLPVTTEIARAGGVELYGYPKFIAGIKFKKGKEWLECRLSEGNKHILTLRGKVLPTARGKPMVYKTYSIKDGIPLSANVNINPIEFAQRMAGAHAELDIGTGHPICRELREIRLGKRPLTYQFSPVNQAILYPPKNLLDS